MRFRSRKLRDPSRNLAAHCHSATDAPGMGHAVLRADPSLTIGHRRGIRQARRLGLSMPKESEAVNPQSTYSAWLPASRF